MKKHGFTLKMTRSVDPAAPAYVWGKGVSGKGGRTTNSSISEKKTENMEVTSTNKTITKENV